jgi:hypothetical protein
MIKISNCYSITFKNIEKNIILNFYEVMFYLDNTNHRIHLMNNLMDIEANQPHAMDNAV